MSATHLEQPRASAAVTEELSIALRFWQGWLGDCVRRIGDFLSATILIAVASPLIGIIALAIKLDSVGPVFSRYRRVLSDGSEIRVVQFRVTECSTRPTRTMCWEKQTTGVGRVLCWTRINSLPQLINVLRGDMTLFRGRGERPDFFRHR